MSVECTRQRGLLETNTAGESLTMAMQFAAATLHEGQLVRGSGEVAETTLRIRIPSRLKVKVEEIGKESQSASVVRDDAGVCFGSFASGPCSGSSTAHEPSLQGSGWVKAAVVSLFWW